MKKIVNVIVLLIMILLISSCVVEEPEYQTVFLYDEYHSNLSIDFIEDIQYIIGDSRVIDIVLKIIDHETNQLELVYCLENGEERKSTSYKWEYIDKSINEDSGLYVTLQNCENEFAFSFVNIYNCVKVKGRQNTIDENISFRVVKSYDTKLIHLSATKQEIPSYAGEYELVFNSDEYRLSYMTFTEEINKARYHDYEIDDIVFKVIDKNNLLFELLIIDTDNAIHSLQIKRARIQDPQKENGNLELEVIDDNIEFTFQIIGCMTFYINGNWKGRTQNYLGLCGKTRSDFGLFNIDNEVLILHYENQIVEQPASIVKEIESGVYQSLVEYNQTGGAVTLSDFELTITFIEGISYNIMITAIDLSTQKRIEIANKNCNYAWYSPNTIEQFFPEDNLLRRFHFVNFYDVIIDGETQTKSERFTIEVIRNNNEILNIDSNIVYLLNYDNKYTIYLG